MRCCQCCPIRPGPAGRSELIGLASQPAQTTGSDRCPYPRPFAPDFSDCPSYQAVTFLAADSQNRRLGSWLTCRHLTSGSDRQVPGRFYPRCALGSLDERRRWLAVVGLARLDVVRALQEEFDDFSLPYREQLFEAKAQLLRSPGRTELRQSLEQLVHGFLAAMDRFLVERELRFQDVGLPIRPLMRLVDEWLWAWVRSGQLANPPANSARLQVFSPYSQSFLEAAAASSWGTIEPQAATQDNGHVARSPAEPTFDNGRLRIVRTADPPGLAFYGDIDAASLDAVAESLASLGPGAGDVEIDLSGVLFCDLGGIRAIVRAAQDQGAGRTLRVRGMPAQLQRAMQLVEWATLPNLVLLPSAGQPR